MTVFEKIVQHFEHFPGIGSRQARRFAFHLLSLSPEHLNEFAELVHALKASMTTCTSCGRYFPRERDTQSQCTICASTVRDPSRLTIVERDTDIDAIERTGVYDGFYFVLGGTVPFLDTQETQKLRGGALKALVDTRASQGLSEIILGFSINPDGENTARYVTLLLKDQQEKYHFTISHLGRGLSTGSELEYADPETIKNALKNRN